MASKIDIELSFSTKPDNLIALYKESGLLIIHYLRRTESNFLIGASRLLNCVLSRASRDTYRSSAEIT
jgi:hypothetical protein